MKKLFVLLLLFPLMTWAQKKLVERVYEGKSNQANAVAARSEILNLATEKVSIDLIKEIIGDTKYNRNKALIQNKILKNSARFIPFSKPGELQPLQPAGFQMNVLLKVSVEDLQSLLLENGLFYETDSAPTMLPAIRLMDRVNGQSYSWWLNSDSQKKSFLAKESRNLETYLKTALLKHNFSLVKADNFKIGELLPSSLRGEALRKEDWALVAQKLGAPILLEGEVLISRSSDRADAFNIQVRVAAVQVMNSRVITEVSRQVETEAGPFEQVVSRQLKEVLEGASVDLGSQLLEAWQRGSLGASLYRLTVKGRMSLLQQEAFKEALKSKAREVKNVRERLISAESIVFEVDSAIGPKEFAQKASVIELDGLKIIFESASEKEAIYRIGK